MKFQVGLSFWALASPARQSGAYLAYGQRSYWDPGDDDRPFRVENDFAPEVGIVWGPDAGQRVSGAWPAGLFVSLAYLPESNGLESDLSRSWNRIVGGLHFESGGAAVRGSVLGWYAFRVEDENADITRDAGDGEFLYESSTHTNEVRLGISLRSTRVVSFAR